MYKSPIIRDRAIAAHKHVVGDRLSEYFDFQHVGDDLFCLAIDVGMHEGDVVVACDDVAECG